MSQFYNNAIFWVEVDKIKPNPFQPRREFDEAKLNDLAKSIRQYGVLQPLVVTRKEVEKARRRYCGRVRAHCG
jgi:ParB/RepB/Spo0J family partition protein